MQRKTRPPLIHLEELLTYRISSLYSLLSAGTAKDLSIPHGLVLREWRVMVLLAGNEPMSGSELAARSLLDKASVSRAVSSLEARKLISVTLSGIDARMKVLRLTDAGWDLYAEVAPRSIARQKRLMSVLTPAERKALSSMLARIEKEAVRYFSGS